MCSEDGWSQCVKRFAESIRHITGQGLGVTIFDDNHTLALQEEIQSLRLQADQLTAEVSNIVQDKSYITHDMVD